MKIFKVILFKVLILISLFLLGCHSAEKDNTITVGTMEGPETELMETAAQVAQQKYGLTVKIVTFSDYNLPNEALADGSLDANMFQHVPFLSAQIQQRGYHLVVVGKTFIYPMGLYSKQVTQLAQIKNGAEIAIPNDPSNEARALLLLEKAGLITLKPNVTINATPLDILKNPKQFKLVELDAAQLPRALSDVALAAINTNYAWPAGLSPQKDALMSEGVDSLYTNVIVARTVDRNNKKILEFVQAFQSPVVTAKAKQLFGDSAIPAYSASSSS